MATKKMVIEGSDKVSASQLKDLFRQIDEEGITGHHLQALLERRNPFESSHFQFLTTCKIGTFKNVTELKEAVYKVTKKSDSPNYAMKAMEKDDFCLTSQEEEIILVTITPEDLGLEHWGISYSEVCNLVINQDVIFKGEDHTVKFCPIEVGAQLRIQYLNQPKNEALFIGSEVFQNQDWHIFCVSNHFSLEIGYGIAPTDNNGYYKQNKFVFCLRKKIKN